MLSKEEFQALLREFGPPLDQCQVKPLSEGLVLASHQVKVCLAITIHGEPKYVEAELDMRSIRDVNDVVGFAGKLLQAFEQAAAQTA